MCSKSRTRAAAAHRRPDASGARIRQTAASQTARVANIAAVGDRRADALRVIARRHCIRRRSRQCSRTEFRDH